LVGRAARERETLDGSVADMTGANIAMTAPGASAPMVMAVRTERRSELSPSVAYEKLDRVATVGWKHQWLSYLGSPCRSRRAFPLD
jgi:hypothetical protein